MSRPLFVGNYMPGTWWALVQWKWRKKMRQTIVKLVIGILWTVFLNNLSRQLFSLGRFQRRNNAFSFSQKRGGQLYINDKEVKDLGVYRNITGFVPQVWFFLLFYEWYFNRISIDTVARRLWKWVIWRKCKWIGGCFLGYVICLLLELSCGRSQVSFLFLIMMIINYWNN